MTDLNRQIEKWVEKLQSPKAGTRYEACEFLRIFPSIPPEALAALEAATHDPDAKVAEAARRAIDHHCKPEAIPPTVEKKIVVPGKTRWAGFTNLILGLFSLLSSPLVLDMLTKGFRDTKCHVYLDFMVWYFSGGFLFNIFFCLISVIVCFVIVIKTRWDNGLAIIGLLLVIIAILLFYSVWVMIA